MIVIGRDAGQALQTPRGEPTIQNRISGAVEEFAGRDEEVPFLVTFKELTRIVAVSVGPKSRIWDAVGRWGLSSCLRRRLARNA